MKKLCVIISIILVAAILGSCALSEGDSLSAKTKRDSSATYGFKKTETSSPATYPDFKSAATDFAFKLLRSSQKDNEDVIIPVAGLFESLAMLCNASSGETQKELKKLIAEKSSLTSVNEGSGYFVSRLEAVKSKNSCVKLDNNIFFDNNTPVSGELLQKNVNYLNQGMFRLDFSDSASLDKADEYVKSRSGGEADKLIKKLSKDMTLSGTTVISDSWLGCFEDSSDSLEGVEYLIKNKFCKGFIKDLKNTPCKFVALMPDGDIGEMLGKLNSESYFKLLESMNIFKTAKVRLEGFKLEASRDFSDDVKKAGVSGIFDNGDFAGLTFGKKASVGEIDQYCSVTINSAGVNTSERVKAKSEKIEAETELSFDKPYVFMIIDNESNVPIVAGIKA